MDNTVTLLAVIAVVLIYAVAKWRTEAEQAKRNAQRKRRKCADAYNTRLRVSYRDWFDSMTKEGYEPSFISNMRELTPDEIGVEEWENPEHYWNMSPDWRSHPDCDALIKQSYTDKQREEMKQPGWNAQRKLRINPVKPDSEK
jgi:hypothetical protein